MHAIMGDSSQPWYHGQMSAEEATAICLRVGQNGAFLVRDSQGGKGVFTLSILFDGEVYHHRITPSGKNNVIMESTTKKFKSLKKLINHYMNPNVDFFHPLTVAIFPSLVQQWKANDQNWEPSVPVKHEPLYVKRKGIATIPPTQIPTPVFPPKVPTASKPASYPGSFVGVNCLQNEVANRPVLAKTNETSTQSPKQDEVQPNMSATSSSVPSISPESPSAAVTPNEENWPEPPSPITAQTAGPPPIKPKPNKLLLRRTCSDSAELKKTSPFNTATGTIPSQVSSTPEGRLTTFKPVDDKNVARAGTMRPFSCAFPTATIIEHVYDVPDGSGDDGQLVPRRRTLSFDEAKKLQSQENNKEEGINIIPQSNASAGFTKPLEDNKSTQSEEQFPRTTTKLAPDKKSKFKSFANFFSRIGRAHPSRKNVTRLEKKDIRIERIVEQKEETTDVEITQDPEESSEENSYNNSTSYEEAIAQDYTPILCKTQFLTTVDYNSSDNGMSYAKGVEMAVKGVRVDGWWYCLNKATQESGWVHMDYLKPKSNEKWFEAKPVETMQDHQLYDRLNFNRQCDDDFDADFDAGFDADFDADFDDDNYCKYLIPSDDVNTEGHLDIGSVS